MATEKAIRTGGEAAAALQEIADVDLPTHLGRRSSPVVLPTISEAKRKQSLNPEAFHQTNGSAEPIDTVLYLAYGSNLCAETFRGKRGIRPLAAVNVVVPELRLTFDLPGLPYTEPCFGNVAWKELPKEVERRSREWNGEEAPLLDRERAPRFHKDRWKKGLVGVVYEVTQKDYATIIATEGGGTAYRDILVTCYVLPDAATVPDQPTTAAFKAHTLCAPHPLPLDRELVAQPTPSRPPRTRSYAQPSARYLKLITDGASEHHLPAEYQAYLHQIRPYTITEFRQRIGQLVFLAIWGPILMTLHLGHRLFDDKRGKSPRWFAAFAGALFIVVWASYDNFFKNLFGDGERTVGQDTDDRFDNSSNSFETRQSQNPYET